MGRVFLKLCVALLLGAVAARPAAAKGGQLDYGPAPDWVRPVPIPTRGVASTDDQPSQVLLYDVQAKLGPDGNTIYVDHVTKVLTPEGLAAANSVSETWDPSTTDLTIDHVRVIRGSQVIDALAGGKKLMVLRRETKLELAMLDGRLTATLEPEGLQVGDVIDFAYTLHTHDPALKGIAEDADQLNHKGVAAEIYWRELWPSSVPIRWRATDGLPAPKLVETAEGDELVFDMRNIRAPKPPLGAPPRFYELGAVEFSQFADWRAVSRLLAPLYDTATALSADSPLKVEIAKIAAATRDPKARAEAALRLVEEQTRYVFLGMNDGGLVPATADETWSRRFGDCKGKTALLVAVLRALGITAEPALVSTAFGDGMDQRLPATFWFDHAIVRAEIGGKTYWLDGTRYGDRSLDDLETPRYYWALPIRDGGAGLVKLSPQPLTRPDVADTMTVDASKGPDAPAPTRLTQTFRGEAAVQLRTVLAGMPRSDFERGVRESLTRAYPWWDVSSLSVEDDNPDDSATIVAEGVGHLDWATEPDGSRLYRVPNTAMGAMTSFKREPGLDVDAPYLVTYPYYATLVRKIILPASADYTLIGVDIDETVAGQALHRRSRIEGGVLTVDSSVRAVEPEFPASEADADAAALDKLAREDVAILARPRAASAEAPPPAVNFQADLQAAGKGDAAAAYRVGESYARGSGVPLDLAAARQWLTRSAQAGDPQSQTALARLLLLSPSAGDQTQAIGWLRKAVAKGAAPAQALLADCFAAGKGVPKDMGQAAFWAQKAADQGDAQGEALLGLAYESGAGVAKDDNRAFVLLTQAAYQGDPSGELGLAGLYHDGLGVHKDTGKAFDLALRAAKQGLASAERAVGLSYELGTDAPQDFAKARAWLLRAEAQGDRLADVALGAMAQAGIGGPADYGQAMDLYRKAADLGAPEGMMGVAGLYEGGLGVGQDFSKAMSWDLKAAVLAEPAAMVRVGELYSLGRGVAADPGKAADWFRKAADLGAPRAQADLAALYIEGRGVARDYGQAVRLAKKAADEKDPRGEFMLGYIFENGLGVTRADGAALEEYAQASAAGDPQATERLGVFYRDGRGGVKADAVKALALLTRAAQGADAVAAVDLGILYERGGAGVPRNLAAAAHWYKVAADHGSSAGRANLARLALVKGAGGQGL